MSWTTPMTFVNGNVLTASQLNTHLRDNLLETEAAKADVLSSLIVSTGANTVVERRIIKATVNTGVEITNTSFAAADGPSVTLTTGTRALCLFGVWGANSVTDTWIQASVAVTGATTITSDSALNDYAVEIDGNPADNPYRFGQVHMFNGTLNAGVNTFTMRYRVQANTGTFYRRELVVIGL